MDKLQTRAFAQVDIASLIFFRVAFGLLMTWEVWRYFSRHRIGHFWLEPPLLFKYYGFSWVHPWPGNGLYIHWAILGVLALFIAIGLFYRVSALLFFLGWTYIFLLDEAQWVNHTYIALLFDLSIVPFLFWRRTRTAAFCAALVFHVLNAQLFYLEVFPWLSIAATTLFLSPSWPRRVLSMFRKTDAAYSAIDQTSPSQRKQSVILTLATIYVATQILVPLRHFLYQGGIEWMYAEHRFSWRMMIQCEMVRAYFYVTDPNSGETFQVKPQEYLDLLHAEAMGWRPDMLLQFAHYLAKVTPRFGPKPLRVEARVLVSLNGRKPQLIVDPNVDLAAESRTLGRPRWLLKIDQPLPDHPFDPSEPF